MEQLIPVLSTGQLWLMYGFILLALLAVMWLSHLVAEAQMTVVALYVGMVVLFETLSVFDMLFAIGSILFGGWGILMLARMPKQRKLKEYVGKL